MPSFLKNTSCCKPMGDDSSSIECQRKQQAHLLLSPEESLLQKLKELPNDDARHGLAIHRMTTLMKKRQQKGGFSPSTKNKTSMKGDIRPDESLPPLKQYHDNRYSSSSSRAGNSRASSRCGSTASCSYSASSRSSSRSAK